MWQLVEGRDDYAPTGHPYWSGFKNRSTKPRLRHTPGPPIYSKAGHSIYDPNILTEPEYEEYKLLDGLQQRDKEESIRHSELQRKMRIDPEGVRLKDILLRQFYATPGREGQLLPWERGPNPDPPPPSDELANYVSQQARKDQRAA